MPAYDGKLPEELCQESIQQIRDGFKTILQVSSEQYNDATGISERCYKYWLELNASTVEAQFRAQLGRLEQIISDPPDVTGLVEPQYGES